MRSNCRAVVQNTGAMSPLGNARCSSTVGCLVLSPDRLIVHCSNVKVMKQRLKDLWKEGTRLCLIPGSTGELAKVGRMQSFYYNNCP